VDMSLLPHFVAWNRGFTEKVENAEVESDLGKAWWFHAD
jgi:hypothetical protein